MDKVVIVTGGGRGIGAATSLLLGSQGYAVCVNYRSREKDAEEVVTAIKELGGKAFAYQADVSDEKSVKSLFDATEDEFGAITHLVNNAGVLATQSRFKDLTVERFNYILLNNVTSCFLCCREAINRMSRGSAIVNVSSAASRSGAPNEYVDYASSKGAVDSLTKGLSVEVASQEIRVNCVRPGFIYTEMHADGGEPNRVDRLSSQIPLQRGGTPREVANSIAWLLSDDASYVTGSFIDIAGGK